MSSTEEWIEKMWYTCTMEYYSAIKGGNNAICSNIHEPRDCHLSELSQTKKDISYFAYVQNLKRNYINELIYKIERLTDLENGLKATRGKDEGKG